MKDPFQKILSNNVQVFYGFKDGHAVVKVRVPPNCPVFIWYPASIPVEAIVRFKTNFEDAHAYGMRPQGERTMEKPQEFYAREDCRGRWGYRDGHVELDIKKVVWIPLSFDFEEFKLAKAAMDEAHAWAQLPQEVRDLQGVA